MKNRPLNLLRMLLVLVGFSLCGSANALSLHLNQEQLDSLLQMSFPLSYQSGVYQITLSEPKSVFFGDQRRVGLDARIQVRDQAGTPAFSGRGIVSGEPQFNTQKNQLQLLRPRLNELDVEQVAPAFKPTLEQTRDSLLDRRMPPILLLDLNAVAPSLPVQTMTSVRVGQNSLIVEF